MASVARISVPSGIQTSTINIGVVDDGKKACFTLVKPYKLAASPSTNTPIVSQARLIQNSRNRR
ncbi:Uncharacterised protein [Vibrio cholerae]|nr:Uncharacterised protein [Vibrio cholerae]CSI52924.1 Uncharacterised protein [Vibrio cholerae]